MSSPVSKISKITTLYFEISKLLLLRFKISKTSFSLPKIEKKYEACTVILSKNSGVVSLSSWAFSFPRVISDNDARNTTFKSKI